MNTTITVGEHSKASQLPALRDRVLQDPGRKETAHPVTATGVSPCSLLCVFLHLFVSFSVCLHASLRVLFCVSLCSSVFFSVCLLASLCVLFCVSPCNNFEYPYLLLIIHVSTILNFVTIINILLLLLFILLLLFLLLFL